jgi:hypothetical protein
MNYDEKINELVKKKPEKVFNEFLLFLKRLYTDYLSDKVDDIIVSDLTVFWYASREDFSDSLIEIDKRIKDFRAGMDITHPDLSKKRKKEIVKELIKRVDEILKERK